MGLKLLLDAAAGLAYLHDEVGVIHGDVKSRNLLVFIEEDPLPGDVLESGDDGESKTGKNT